VGSIPIARSSFSKAGFILSLNETIRSSVLHERSDRLIQLTSVNQS